MSLYSCVKSVYFKTRIDKVYYCLILKKCSLLLDYEVSLLHKLLRKVLFSTIGKKL